MNINLEGKELVLSDIDFFDPDQIFKCGQAFRWQEREDGSFDNVAFSRVINISKNGNNIIFKNTDLEEFYNIWFDYFDLARNYDLLRSELSIDKTLADAMLYGKGIRILNQDPFETIITFIISANNQIPRIKKSIEKIASMYGEKLIYKGKEYFSFPSAEELSMASIEDLREYARVGFRDKRIVESSKIIANGLIDLDSLYTLPIEDARKELIKLPGVGPKVADCVLLFAFKREESFPVDVWIKRVMEKLYLKKDTNKNKIAEAGREIFGKNAGFAQQYLFFYGREHKLGR